VAPVEQLEPGLGRREAQSPRCTGGVGKAGACVGDFQQNPGISLCGGDAHYSRPGRLCNPMTAFSTSGCRISVGTRMSRQSDGTIFLTCSREPRHSCCNAEIGIEELQLTREGGELRTIAIERDPQQAAQASYHLRDAFSLTR
jgi:hypothetical protein